MIPYLACFAAGVILGVAGILIGISGGSASHEHHIWLAGHAAGIRDERAERLATALWDADHLQHGGTE